MQISKLLKCNKLLNFVLIFALFFGVLSIPTGIAYADSIAASNVLLNPTVIVKVSENEIRTYLWKKGTKVRLTIDDPANGIGIDYSETLPVLEGSNLAKDLLFRISDFELRPGQLITLTDGTSTDTVLISPINITNIDSPTPNTIYGTGLSGSLIYLKIDTETKSINLQAKVGTDGTWFVNAGSEFSIATILKITCSITDSDKDIVYFTGPIKKPHFEANLSLNTLEGWDWQFGKMLTVKIDDPENGSGFDFSGTTLMNESYFYPRFVLDLGTFKLAADQTVMVSDGTITKRHVLRGLEITEVDFKTDLIKGNTDTKDEIHTWINDNNGHVIKRTNSVKKGIWTSDFAHSGDQSWEVDTFDITESTMIFSK